MELALFRPKHTAGDHGLNQRPQSVLVPFRLLHNAVDDFTVGEPTWSSGRVGQQLSRNIRGECVVVGNNQFLKFLQRRKVPSVRHVKFRIHFNASSTPPLNDGDVSVTPSSRRIKVLQGEAGRIDFHVATRTRIVRLMFGQHFSNGLRPPNVGFNRRNVFRRWRNLDTQ